MYVHEGIILLTANLPISTLFTPKELKTIAQPMAAARRKDTFMIGKITASLWSCSEVVLVPTVTIIINLVIPIYMFVTDLPELYSL